MNKENNRSAAGLRRSAIAERIRLREEWSALKEIDSQPPRPNTVLNKKQNNVKSTKLPVKEMGPPNIIQMGRLNRQSNSRSPSAALRGVVALVEVGSEARALPLRAALSALGASVMPAWSPLITHLVWAQGGCHSTRARARALASALVSPLWVEACAACASRLPERSFPAAPRPSDLPSPHALRVALKKAEAENLSLFKLDNSDEKEKIPRLRISSETEHDTSAETSMDTSKDTSRDTSKDTSRDTSKDTSRDTSKDTSRDTLKDISRETSKDTSKDSTKDISKDATTDIESRVNTAPRRMLPKMSESVSPLPKKSRRKLFTQKEAEVQKSTDDEEDDTRPRIPKPQTKQTRPKAKKPEPSNRKELARAERMAKKLIQACNNNKTQKTRTQQITPRIVLTGMCSTERREMMSIVLSLKGRVQRCVNKRTTHVVLGSFQETPERGAPECSGIINISQEALNRTTHNSKSKARTLSSLLGAARGCRVLHAAWLRDCAVQRAWTQHGSYEVQHLKKIAQKARVERAALRKTRSDYAYDIFCGMRVLATPTADQRDAAIELLNLCGAVVVNQGEHVQNGGITQNGGKKIQQGLTQLDKLLGTQKVQPTQRTQHALITQNGEIRYGLVHNNNQYDIKIGVDNNEVSSKWVFDSVAAGRMRTTRRYVVKECPREVVEVLQSFCIDDC